MFLGIADLFNGISGRAYLLQQFPPRRHTATLDQDLDPGLVHVQADPVADVGDVEDVAACGGGPPQQPGQPPRPVADPSGEPDPPAGPGLRPVDHRREDICIDVATGKDGDRGPRPPRRTEFEGEQA